MDECNFLFFKKKIFPWTYNIWIITWINSIYSINSMIIWHSAHSEFAHLKINWTKIKIVITDVWLLVVDFVRYLLWIIICTQIEKCPLSIFHCMYKWMVISFPYFSELRILFSFQPIDCCIFCAHSVELNRKRFSKFWSSIQSISVNVENVNRNNISFFNNFYLQIGLNSRIDTYWCQMPRI